MSDHAPFVVADAEDVPAPATVRYPRFSMQGPFEKFGVNWIQTKNVVSFVEASDTGEDGEWVQIWGENVTAGGESNSVTFGASPANYMMLFQNGSKYFRIAAQYTNSDNRLHAEVVRV